MAKFTLTQQDAIPVTKPAEKPVVAAVAPKVEEKTVVEMTPAPPVVTPPAPEPEKRFRVVQDVRAKSGSATFLLRAGKILSSYGYDIDKLRAQGAKLEEVASRS